MIFNYPKNALTLKDLSRFTYLTYASLSFNLNRLNHDGSNTFKLLDVSAIEMLRTLNDLQYLPTFSLEKLDFVCIDRINRFNISQISNFDNTLSYPKCNTLIKGFSSFTNTIYDLKNVNSFTDFTRHSLPIDIFLETAPTVSHTSIDVILLPNVEYIIDPVFNVNRSRVSIVLSNIDISDRVTTNNPYVELKGLDLDYKEISEIVYLDSSIDIKSSLAYTSINSVLSNGLSDQISIIIFPYMINKSAALEYPYTDREDFFNYDSIFTLNVPDKSLCVSRLNDASIYPPEVEEIEKIDLNIPADHIVDQYHFDGDNKLLYVISKDLSNYKYLNIFPIIIPFYQTNISKAVSTEQQNIKVEYIKDTIDKKYIFTIFPSDKSHGVEQLDISILLPYKVAKGLWYESTVYDVGDLVLYANREFVCRVAHTSNNIFNIDNFTVQKQYIVQGFLLDLISYGIETNKFEIKFSDLFENDCEAIVCIEITGNSVCTLHVLLQNHKLNPLIFKSMSDIMINLQTNVLTSSDTIMPIENMSSKILTNKLNNYFPAKFLNLNFQTENFYIYSISSTETIGLNDYSMINIFDSFYLDWNNKNIITSDTITHVINLNGRDVNSCTIMGTIPASYVPSSFISDDYERIFFG